MTLPAKDLVVQSLLEFDPSFDTGEGVPTTALMIEPLAVILQPVLDELSVIQASRSVLTVLESSDPDGFPEDIVDGLASNAFVERNPGEIGSDVQRVRFFEPQDFSAQQGVLIFRGPSGQRYTNSEAISITSAEMSLNEDGALYYVDIPIVSLEEGSSFNANAGSITTMEAEPRGVANTANLFGVENGRDRETNTELIDRIKVATTVRALVTGRGIIVTLTENFTSIKEIQPVGFGDPEMMRDIIYNVHVGGNVDVYVKTGSLSSDSKDVFSLEVDTTRQRDGRATLVALKQDIGYSLGSAPIDRTNEDPLIYSIDGANVFTEGVDYEIDDATGLLSRIAGSNIFHLEVEDASITDSKTIEKTGAPFSEVRPGMIVTIDVPGSVAGTYTVKSVPNSNTVKIFSEFDVASASGVDLHVDDNLVASFQYNPVSVDVIEEARSSDREGFTITDVPLMYIESVEKLDPLSGEPTGEVLSGDGGYGYGGYGKGGYGVGGGADYKLVVEKPVLRFSASEDNYIEFDGALVGTSVRITYKHASGIPPIQAFMDDRNNQSMTASLLAKHFIPIYVDGTSPISYTIPKTSQATALSVEDMAELVKNFIDDVDEGEGLQLSSLVDLLYNNGAIRVSIDSLKKLRGIIHHQNGTTEFVSPDEAGVISIPDEDIPDPSDKPISSRIARFIPRDVTLERSTA